jgi:hypothetical protein
MNMTPRGAQNRNASRDLYNSTTEVYLSLPPLHARNHSLRPEGFTYGKPSIYYNTNPYEKKPADRCLNGAFAWKAHEVSKGQEFGQDFAKLNVMSVRNSIVLPKVNDCFVILISKGCERIQEQSH